MADKVGVFNRLGYDDNTTTATVEFEFLAGSTIGVTEQVIGTDGMRGSRSHFDDRARRGTRRVDGTLMFAPTPAELNTLLYLALGGTKSGNTIPLAEALPEAYWIAVRDGTTYSYNGCVVDTLTITAQEGGPVQASLQVVGKDEAEAGSIGANTIDASTGGPFVLTDGALTIASTTYEFSSIEVRVENRLEVKYRNSLTPTQIKATDRIVTVSLGGLSLGDSSAVYGSAATAVAVAATFTNGAFSLGLSMAKVRAPKQPLPFGQRGILDLAWQGVARKTGSTDELVVTVDSTA